MEFCVICGETREGHPSVPPGPPSPPPQRHEGVWRPPHNFEPSNASFAAVLKERDEQIQQWRTRAHRAERKLREVARIASEGAREGQDG